MINLNKTIKNLRGVEVSLTFPTKQDIESLPEIEKGKYDTSQLRKETVRDVLLNCLSRYVVEDKRETFYVQNAASAILSEDEKIELKEKAKKFVIKVLHDSVIRTIKNDKGESEEKGIYYSWVISQVLSELGEAGGFDE